LTGPQVRRTTSGSLRSRLGQTSDTRRQCSVRPRIVPVSTSTPSCLRQDRSDPTSAEITASFSAFADARSGSQLRWRVSSPRGRTGVDRWSKTWFPAATRRVHEAPATSQLIPRLWVLYHPAGRIPPVRLFGSTRRWAPALNVTNAVTFRRSCATTCRFLGSE
jgi:hypothetical protein